MQRNRGNRMGKISDFFKKIRDTKGISHAKMGTMKDRNASNRRKRYQEEVARIHRRTKKQQQQTNKKNLHKSDNHGGVIIHLEPDILECKVKWALRSITTNKADGDDGIPVELFQILKENAAKVLHSICHKFGKFSNGHSSGIPRTFQFQGKAMPKNVQTTAQLHPFHMLVM